MKKILIFIFLLCTIYIPSTFSQPAAGPEVYLLTCGVGAETYSIYGHSAIRILDQKKHIDLVYNWGIFDFDTPHFAWKFAKGRLNYMLGAMTMQSFMQEYFLEKRSVHSQKINLSPDETEQLIALINENLKPENVKYRYDFFYDDCSTRIRDLLEKSIGEKLLYPPSETKGIPTFRSLIHKYQSPYSWLNFGIDLLVGSPSDIKAQFRDRMFLPIEMQKELSEAVIRRDSKMIPLLQNPETILDFDPPVVNRKFLTSPSTIFTLLFIVAVILTSFQKRKKLINTVDITLFSIFSILAILMIFFNFFTDHQQTRWNLNIIWLNPFLIICLIMLILKKSGTVWFKIVFFITLTFLIFQYFLPQVFNSAIFPLVCTILVRSSVRARFSWNPLSIK
ncbi:MAG: DUF4105 domain-containing protein [Bacteroidales bacterium]|nr:DUF4105 domain-containing protein [Bacteroidales bacterium]